MFQGWQDDLIQQQDTARTVAMLIADVTNKSMGGKGVMKNMFSIWPLPGDPGGKGGDGIDPALMEKLNRRLAEQQKLKGGRN